LSIKYLKVKKRNPKMVTKGAVTEKIKTIVKTTIAKERW
jgi:hypothetical protein